MSIKAVLIFIFFLCFSTPIFSQGIQDAPFLKEPRSADSKEWHTYPSLRWNFSALANPWVPAASLVFEYPLMRHLGLEFEGGPLLPYATVQFRGESFSGYRARISPKFYLIKDPQDFLYLRLTAKYDRFEASTFRTVLDPSQSFQQEIRVDQTFEMRGVVLYLGHMMSFWEDRLVLDLSAGVGYSEWEEQFVIPDRGTIIREFIFGERNEPSGAIPVISFNLQFGYRFGSTRNK